MDPQLTTLTDVLARTEARLSDQEDTSRVWATGLGLLDKSLGGGLRSGSLVVLSGQQSVGKTTLALQVARNVAMSGRSVIYFSFQHPPDEMLGRLVTLEAGELGGDDAPTLGRIRAALDGSDGRTGSLVERLEGTPTGAAAVLRVQSYADRVCFHRSTGSATSIPVMIAAIDEVWDLTQEPPFVVVDYLQKISVPEAAASEHERVTIAVERLKDVAIDAVVPVLAVVAADKPTTEADTRVRARDMRGSTALAHEPDVVLMLNDKFDVVARHHLVYDSSNAERFHDWAVVTIEKNRMGDDDVDLEFRKRFEQCRFDPEGRRVVERLLDDRLYRE